MQNAHTKEEFNVFLSQLKNTNAPLNFFSDFKKIETNVDLISMKLNQLNYLIGKEDMEKAVNQLWNENKKVFDVLDILIAVRKKDKKQAIDSKGNICFIDDFFTSPESVLEFIEGTGLKEVFQNKKVTNLVDYVFGVETGLDSNARKNRSGHIMEGEIAKIFEENNIPYGKEVVSTDFKDLTSLGEDMKRFDFTIKTKVKTYLIEVNFYSGGGSKPNEVARAYSDIAPKINQYSNYEFVWITDGKGWNSAKNKIEEAFFLIPKVYNLTSIKEFINIVKDEGF
jgi:type II restriction enzyme